METEKAVPLLNLLLERMGIEPPSPETIKTFLQKFNSPLRQKFISDISSNNKEILALLSELKTMNPESSRPALCAGFLKILIQDRLLSLATKALYYGNKQAFVFFFDFARGSNSVLEAILSAEDEIAGRVDKEITAHLSQSNRLLSQTFSLGETSVGDQTEQYLSIKSETVSYAKLLQKDPSGFLVVDTYVSKLMDEPVINSGFVEEYQVASAQLGRDLYKKTYGMVEKLYPNKNKPR